MTELPYMPLYVAELDADTGTMSDAEFGTYVRLLCVMWRQPDASIPSDDKRMASAARISITRWRKHKSAICPLLDFCDGMVTQKRLRLEHQKGREIAKRNAANGRKGGVVKSLKNQGVDLATARAIAEAPANPSATPSDNPKGTSPGYGERQSIPKTNSKTTTSSIPEPRQNSEEKKECGSAPMSPGAALPDGAHPSPSTSEAKGNSRNVHSLLDTPAMRRADAKLGRIT